PMPSASASERAAFGTPGGRTPSTRSTRSASSGVSAETIEMRPAAAADHASSTGVAGRRTPEGYLGSVVEEDAPQLVLLAGREDREHLVAGLDLGLLVRDLGFPVADDGDEARGLGVPQR